MTTKVSLLFAVMLLLAGCVVVLPGPCAGEVRIESEPNNSFDNATMLSLGESCTGSVGFSGGSGADDVDYFGFNVTNQTLLSVTVTITATKDSGLTGVYNDSRKTVGTGLGIAAGKSWTWQQNVGTHGGAWYLSVRGSETNYTINLQGTTVVPDLPPVVVITGPANGSNVYEPLVEVNGTATDENGIREVYVYVEGAPPAEWVKAAGTSSWAASVFIADYMEPHGHATIIARASDTGGKTGTASAVVHLGITGTSGPGAPVLRITEPANGTVFINTEQITVRGTAHHPNGIKNGHCYVFPGNESPFPMVSSDGYRNWTATVRLLPGASTITAYVHDFGFNCSYAYALVRLNITTMMNDTTPPHVNITNLPDGTHLERKDSHFKLEGVAWDDHRVVYVSIRVGSGRPIYAYPANVTGRYEWSETIYLKEGDNVINVTAYDYSNNSQSEIITVNFKLLPAGGFIPGPGAPALAAAYFLALCLLWRRKRSS